MLSSIDGWSILIRCLQPNSVPNLCLNDIKLYLCHSVSEFFDNLSSKSVEIIVSMYDVTEAIDCMKSHLAVGPDLLLIIFCIKT